MLLRPVLNLLHRVKTRMADFVAGVFCPSECVRLIQDQASMRNVDSRIHSGIVPLDVEIGEAALLALSR